LLAAIKPNAIAITFIITTVDLKRDAVAWASSTLYMAKMAKLNTEQAAAMAAEKMRFKLATFNGD
jgi:hypothetical protein